MKLGLRKTLALEAFRLYRHSQAKSHPLTYLFWECTLRCNLRCLHCGSDCLVEAIPDMPREEFLRVLDSLAPHVDPKRLLVVLTGGEPLMRADLEECGRGIMERGHPWGMVTNGLLMTPERHAALLDAGLRNLTISLDGLEESHNRFRGNPHSFDRAVRALELAVRTPGLTFDAMTCVNRRNLPELPEVRDMLVRMGVPRWRVAIVFPKGRAKGNPLFELSDREFRGVYDFIRETKKAGKIRVDADCEGFLGSYEKEARSYPFFCRAGINVGSVLCDGSISACPSLRGDYVQGNVRRDDFWDVWQNRFQVMRDRSWARVGDCAKCRFWRYCEGSGLHLRDGKTGELAYCQCRRIEAGAE
ncbi:MAG: TIGR04133 family radical SAM/SPASM protein [Fibrobacterales bacterium]|nr:TIGR04133 family radical SAM/SPASM protein [Fibrobacterales bacterium]